MAFGAFILTPLPLLVLVFLAFLTYLVKLVLDSRKAGLSHVPGPWLAKYTDGWKFFQACIGVGKKELLAARLMEMYGDVVRIGPTSVAVFDHNAVTTIFGAGTRYNKSEGYKSFCPPGVDTVLVSILEEDRHAKYRRPVANAYSLSSLKGYEPYVDKTIRLFIHSLTNHAEAKTVINISTWCYYYAFDIIGMLTFGKPLGFLETGHDVSGLTQLQKNSTWYAVTMFHVPWLERLIKKSGILERIGSGGFNNFVDARVQVRLDSKPSDPENAAKPDLLAHMITAQGRYPDVVTDEQIAIYCADNLFAGGQSISYVLDTICEWLALYPAGQEKLYRELVSANISFPPSFSETQALPYLDSVIREGLRLHGIGFLLLERIVPKDGLTLPDGTYLPPGTTMGMPPTGMKRRKVVYGADAYLFVPERWMQRAGESDEAFAARRAVMERTDLTFGHGSRTCIGRNIVTLEIYKLVATLVGLFQIEAVGKVEMFKVDAVLRRRETQVSEPE